MVANLESSTQRGKPRTRRELSVQDRLEILQQALIDLASSGIAVRVTRMHGHGEHELVIVLSGVELVDGRLIASSGKVGDDE